MDPTSPIATYQCPNPASDCRLLAEVLPLARQYLLNSRYLFPSNLARLSLNIAEVAD